LRKKFSLQPHKFSAEQNKEADMRRRLLPEMSQLNFPFELRVGKVSEDFIKLMY
jgi:hypothetical protein